MSRIIAFFIERTFLVNLITGGLCLLGLISTFGLRRDLIPPLEFNKVSISTNLDGASAEQMERLITGPVENSLQGLAGLSEVQSWTYEGAVYLDLDFDLNTKMPVALERIEQRLNGLKESLPNELEEFTIELREVTSSPIGGLKITGIDPTNTKHRGFLELLTRDLLKIPGLISINSSLPTRRLLVTLQPERLRQFGLSALDIQATIRQSLIYSPVGLIEPEISTSDQPPPRATPRKSGEQSSESTNSADRAAENSNQDLSQTARPRPFLVEVDASIKNLKDLQKLPIKVNRRGQSILLSEVAKVEYSVVDSDRLELIDGQSNITFFMQKDMLTDSITVSKAVHAKVQSYRPQDLPQGVQLDFYSDASRYIEKQLQVLGANGSFGLLLVLLTLTLFVGWRYAAVTAAGLPVAYLGTAGVLYYLGISVDLISVVAMILIVGILVDDAIIVVERYSEHLEQGATPKEAATQCAIQLIRPITGTVATTMIAFAPILTVKHPVSTVLYSIPIVIIAGLLLSWIECFFILPNHLAHFVKKPPKARFGLLKKLRASYERVLFLILKLRYVVLAALIGLFIHAGWCFGELPKEWFFSTGAERLSIDVVFENVRTLDEAAEAAKPLEALVTRIASGDLDYLTTSIGSAYIGGKSFEGPRYATVTINLPPTHPSPEATLARLKTELQPRLERLVSEQGSTYRQLSLEQDFSGTDDDQPPQNTLTVFAYGGDRQSISAIERAILVGLEPFSELSAPALGELSNESENMGTDDQEQRVLRFKVRPEALERYGLNPSSLALQLRTKVAESTLDTIRLEGEMVPIVTTMAGGSPTPAAVVKSSVLSQQGLEIPLTLLGEWAEAQAPRSIKRIDGERALTFPVQYDLDAIDGEQAQTMLEKSLEPVRKQFPSYQFQVTPSSREEEETKRWAINLTAICLTGILLVLAAVLGNLTQTLIVGLAIPFGIVGVLYATFVADQTLNIMAVIGLIGVAGVAVNDALVMVDSINLRRSQTTLDGFGRLSRTAVISAAGSRIRPILLTTVTTLGGVFPMAYGWLGESGFTAPLAFAMAWGLTSATLLTLITIPALVVIREDMVTLWPRLASLWQSKRPRKSTG